MIISADKTNDFIGLLNKISDSNPFACRIASLYLSYNPSLPFVDYWVIKDDESGDVTGAVARSGTDFILCITENTDLDEISSFMRVAGATSVICSDKFELDLFGYKKSIGPILSRKSYESNPLEFEVKTPDIKEAYALIVKSADENFIPPDFDDFYVDINHKLRHNTMRMFGIYEDERLTSVAMTVAESENGAVIGAVACDPECRNRGYGSYIVNYITNTLVAEDKCVYVHRAENANKAFYENLHFVKTDNWCEYHFEG